MRCGFSEKLRAEHQALPRTKPTAALSSHSKISQPFCDTDIDVLFFTHQPVFASVTCDSFLPASVGQFWKLTNIFTVFPLHRLHILCGGLKIHCHVGLCCRD